MRSLKIALAAAMLGIAAVPSTQAATITIQRAPTSSPVMRVPDLKMYLLRLECKSWGTPVEFPSDILLSNTGTMSLAAGTKIHWDMPAPHYQGNYTLTAPLPAGGHVFVYNVIVGGAAAGTLCNANVIN